MPDDGNANQRLHRPDSFQAPVARLFCLYRLLLLLRSFRRTGPADGFASIAPPEHCLLTCASIAPLGTLDLAAHILRQTSMSLAAPQSFPGCALRRLPPAHPAPLPTFVGGAPVGWRVCST